MMKKLLLALGAAVVLLTAGSLCNVFAADVIAPRPKKPTTPVPVIKTEKQNTLKVMTMNVRVANETDPYPWSKRKIAMREFLKVNQPDVFGTQETLYFVIKDLLEGGSDYDWVGLGREGGTKGEFMAIFFKKDRFEPMEYDHVWLSENPRLIGSMSWDTCCTRMVTWVRLLDKETGQQFYFVNTHLDHVSQLARVNGAKVIAETIAKLDKKLPLFLTGDFNTPSTNKEVHDVFTNTGLSDTWDTAEVRSEQYATYNAFKAPQKDGQRIDWIFTRAGMKVYSTDIMLNKEGAVYVSDHFPVISVVEWPEKK